jgi:hypothetical protein
MSRTSWRIGVAIGAMLLALVGAADAARACNLPKISVSPASAGHGDLVTWTIGDIEPRATYTVTIAGRMVAEGESGGSAPTGTFSMPDFGGTPRVVSVQLDVRHAEASSTHEAGNNSWRNSAPVTYRPPSAPPQVTQESPPTSTPVTPPPADGLGGAAPETGGSAPDRAADGPRAPGQPTRRPAAREPAPRIPATTRSPVPVGGTPTPDTATAPAGVEPRTTGRSSVDARGRSSVDARGRSTVNTADGSAVAETGRSGVKASELRTEPGERVSPRARPQSRTLPRVHEAEKVVRPLEDGDAIPGIVLVGLSALVVLGVGAVAIWVLYPRGSAPGSRMAEGGPQWVPPGLGLEARSRDLLIEAELQEMIAEERARRLPRRTAAIARVSTDRVGHER